MPSLVSRLPAQAIPVRLAGFDSALPARAQDVFHTLFGEEKFRVVVEGSEGGLAVVQAHTVPPGARSINAELKEATRSKEESKRGGVLASATDLEELYITKFDTCNNFYGQQTRAGLSELNDFLALVSDHCLGNDACPLYRGSESHRGEVCAVPDPAASRRWYRARLVKDSGPGPVEVTLLDVGGRQVVERRDVIGLPVALARRQEFGMICSLGAAPGWREPARLKQVMTGSVVEVRKVRRLGEASWVVQLTRNSARKFKNRLIHELCDLESPGRSQADSSQEQSRGGGVKPDRGRSRGPESQEKENADSGRVFERGDLRNSLRERRAAREAVLKEAAGSLATKLRHGALRVGQRGRCKITWIVDPSHFYITMVESGPQFEKMMGKLQGLASGSNSDVKTSRGSVVAAKWTDGCWYRGQVTGNRGGAIEIYFVDFGNTEKVERDCVVGLPFELGQLDTQACRVSLADVEPAGPNGWACGDTLAKYFGQEMWEVEVVGESRNSREWLVSLNGGEVEAAMIRDGEAKERGGGEKEEEEEVVTPPLNDLTRTTKASQRRKAGKYFSIGDFPLVASSSLVGRAVTGSVTYWTSWREFWLRPDQANPPEVEALMVAGKQGKCVQSLEEGECCLASWDGAWHRAAVLVKAEPLKLSLVDSGLSVELPLSELRSATDFAVYDSPPAAVCCRFDTKLENLGQLLEATGDRLSVQVRSFNNNQFCVKLEKEKTEKERKAGRKAAKKSRDGGRREVTVVHVSKVSLVWVVDKEKMSHLEEMMTQLGIWMADEEHWVQKEDPKEGDLCCIRFSEDGEMYRGKVEAVAEDEVEVQYIDYGNSETLPKNEVLELPEQFHKQEAAAAPLEVIGAHMALDCEETRSRLESVLASEGVAVQQEGPTAGSLYIKGKKLELGRLLRVGGSVNMFQVADSPRAGAVISWWGEEGLWLVADILGPKLQALMARLQNEASGLAAAGRVREGDMVAARYSLDSAWYRARILSLRDGEAEVQFVDFGNKEKVTAACLKSLPGELRLHPGFAMQVTAAKEDGRTLARADLRRMVRLGEAVTAELLQPREGRVRLFCSGEAIYPPPALATFGLAPARLRPGEVVLGLVTGVQDMLLLVQALTPHARVITAISELDDAKEVVDPREGQLVVQMRGKESRRLAVCGGGRLLDPDSQLEEVVVGTEKFTSCPTSLARLPSAGLALAPHASNSVHPLPGSLVLLTAGPLNHLTIFQPTIHVAADFGKAGLGESESYTNSSLFQASAPLLLHLPSAPWCAADLCKARDAAICNILGSFLGEAAPDTLACPEKAEQEFPTTTAVGVKGHLKEIDNLVMQHHSQSIPMGVNPEILEDGNSFKLTVHSDLPGLSLAKNLSLKVMRIEGHRLVGEVGGTRAKLEEVLSREVDGSSSKEKWEVGQLALYLGKERCAVVGVVDDVIEVSLVDTALDIFCHPDELRTLPEALLGIPPAAVEVEMRGGKVVEVGAQVDGLLVKDPDSGLLLLEPA